MVKERMERVRSDWASADREIIMDGTPRDWAAALPVSSSTDPIMSTLLYSFTSSNTTSTNASSQSTQELCISKPSCPIKPS